MVAIKKESSLNWKKTIENFRGNYTINKKIDVLFIELIANAIDAHAKTLKITVDYDGNKIKFVDDGKGMNGQEFDEYHNLGSISKERGETIGFAGIGAKLYMDRCEKVVTATIYEGDENVRKSEWGFESGRNRLTYEINELRRGSTLPKRGTVVEVWKPEDLKDTDLTYITNLMLDHYNFSMNGYTDNPLAISLNNSPLKIRPIGQNNVYRIHNEGTVSDQPAVPEHKRGRKRKPVSVEGDIAYNTDGTTEGIAIVVNGKTVQTVTDLFGQLTKLKDPSKTKYVRGYIRCDQLIQAVETSKDRFNTTKVEYRRFLNIVQKEVESALRHWGLAKEERKESINSQDEKDISIILGELIRSEQLEEIFSPSGKYKMKTTVPDKDGIINASLKSGKESTLTNHLGGGEVQKEHRGFTEGLGNGLAFHEDPEGSKKALKKLKSRSAGPPIQSVPGISEDKKRVKINGGRIIVYVDHPALKLLQKFGGTRSVDRRYYLLDASIEAICELKGEADKDACRARLFEQAFNPVEKLVNRGSSSESLS